MHAISSTRRPTWIQPARRCCRPSSWHEACFLARECVEKSLKGFLEAAGKEAPPLHGSGNLLRECAAVDREFARLQHHCRRLSRYQEVARYPPVTDDYTFTEEEAGQSVHLADEVLSLVLGKVEWRKQAGLL